MHRNNPSFKTIQLPLFLTALLLFLIAYPYLHQAFPSQIAIVELFFALIMVSGISLLSNKKPALIIMVILAILILVGIFLAGYTQSQITLLITMSIEFIFFLIIFMTLISYIYGEQTVTLNKLYAAITSYLVLGILFAILYAIVATMLPNAFQYTANTPSSSLKLFPHPDFFSEALYFSFVTLATLGYGDWVPVFGPLKMVSSLEAITGQLFIAILIARLVGVQITQCLIKRS